MRRTPKLILRLLPWVVTVGLLGFLLWRTPVVRVLELTRSAAAWTPWVAVATNLAIFFADGLAMYLVFGWFVTRLRFRDVLLVRGASYLLAAINYSVGQGGIVYFVHRVAGVPLRRGTGTVLLIMGTNLLLLLVAATAGLWLTSDAPPGLALVVRVGYAGLLLYALTLLVRPRWLREKPVLEVLFDSGISGHLKATIVRVPHLVGLIAYQYAMLRAFGIDVPLGQAILLLPVLFFVAVLPISVQGLGTTQATMIFLFAGYAPGTLEARQALVLACSLTGQALALSVQALIGVVCLRTWTGRILRQRDPELDAQKQPQTVS